MIQKFLHYLFDVIYETEGGGHKLTIPSLRRMDGCYAYAYSDAQRPQWPIKRLQDCKRQEELRFAPCRDKYDNVYSVCEQTLTLSR